MIDPIIQRVVLMGLEIGDHISWNTLPVESKTPTIDVAVLEPRDQYDHMQPLPMRSITLERVPQGWKRIR